MIKAAIEKIESMAKAERVQIAGVEYSSKLLHKINPPLAVGLVVHTLSGVKDVIVSEKIEEAIIHICDETSVDLISPLKTPEMLRHVYCHSANIKIDFRYEQFLPIEQFIIAIQSKCVDTKDRAALLDFVSNIREEASKDMTDNGVSQTVAMKSGIAKVTAGEVPGRVTLQPFRTFIEVKQPESEFILRAKKTSEGVMFALFEADGGAWRNEAIKNIFGYFYDEYKDNEKIRIIA